MRRVTQKQSLDDRGFLSSVFCRKLFLEAIRDLIKLVLSPRRELQTSKDPCVPVSQTGSPEWHQEKPEASSQSNSYLAIIQE